MGIIYLLHLEKPLAHAKHYIGYTENLPARMEAHRRGVSGVKMMRAAFEKGIGFYLVRVWKGGRTEERRLKRTGSAPTYCPICCGRVEVADKQLFSRYTVDDPHFGRIKVREIPIEEEECPF